MYDSNTFFTTHFSICHSFLDSLYIEVFPPSGGIDCPTHKCLFRFALWHSDTIAFCPESDFTLYRWKIEIDLGNMWEAVTPEHINYGIYINYGFRKHFQLQARLLQRSPLASVHTIDNTNSTHDTKHGGSGRVDYWSMASRLECYHLDSNPKFRRTMGTRQNIRTAC